MKINLREDILELIREDNLRRDGAIVTNHDREAEIRDLIASKIGIYVLRQDRSDHYNAVLEQAKKEKGQ